LDLRKVPEKQRLANGPQLAQDLEQILDRDVRFDVAALSPRADGSLQDGVSRNREVVDTFPVGGREVDLQLDRVTLRSGDSVWLFSAESIGLIPQIAQALSESPVERHLPAILVTWKVLDTPIWRWIALALLAAGLALLSKIVSRWILRLAEPVLKRIAPSVHWGVLELFAGPLRMLFSVAGFRAGMAWMEPSALPRLYLERALTLLFSLSLVWLSSQVVDLANRHVRSVLGGKFQTLSYSVIPLASRVIKLCILLLAIAATLDNWGYNTRTILATLGLGGLAIALAAQKTVENLFGGVAVISDRPVVVGDFCKFGDQVGTVEDIGLRSTRIRTLDRTLVTVPNGQFSSMTLENFSSRDKMLLHITLNLLRNTTPDQMRVLLASLTTILTTHENVETGPLPVRFIGVGTYSLDLEVFAYVLTPSFDEFLRIRQDLLLTVLDAIEAAGTALAVPTQANIGYKATTASNGKVVSPSQLLTSDGQRLSAGRSQ
jgi:MscS family membrane protein